MFIYCDKVALLLSVGNQVPYVPYIPPSQVLKINKQITFDNYYF